MISIFSTKRLQSMLWTCGLAASAASLSLPALAESQNTLIGGFNNAPAAEEGQRFEGTLAADKARWPDSTFEWYYDPTNRPPGADDDMIVHALKEAAQRWSGMCKINIVYKGITSAPTSLADGITTVGLDTSKKDGRNVIGWRVFSDELAALCDPISCIAGYDDGSSIKEVDLLNNAGYFTSFHSQLDDPAFFQGTMTRMFGFMIGLRKSNQESAVLTGDGQLHSKAFMSTLKADDIANCQALYGAAPTADTNRIFNWGSTLFAPQSDVLEGYPGTTVNGEIDGWNYRYFAKSNIYFGEYDGTIYYLLPGGEITPFASVSELLPLLDKNLF